jgi:hypothetical protein
MALWFRIKIYFLSSSSCYDHIRNYHTENVNVVWHVYCSGVNNFSNAFNYFKITAATAMKLETEKAKCS